MPKHHAFLSYSKRYATWAKCLAANLEKCLGGRRVWFDESDLASPRSLTQQLHEGARDADYLIVLVTPEAMASDC